MGIQHAGAKDGPGGLPPAAPDWCLFFDFDGTLTGIVDHPEDIVVEMRMIDVLGDLARLLDGAVAVVSGRPIADIDRFLHPLTLPVAGKHGLEIRMPDGRRVGPEAPSPDLAVLRDRLAADVAGWPGVMLEDKGHTVALHYRRAPDKADECRRMVAAALAAQPGDLQVLDGKMVIEVKPRHGDKGKAVETFMAKPPFHGRRPLYAGDDVTDEDAFAVVNAVDGVSIRVGDAAESLARFRVAGVCEFLDWLEMSEAALRSAPREPTGSMPS